MTDKTDIKALRELALNANMAITRLSANGEGCLYAIGEDPKIDQDVELSNEFHNAFCPIVVIYLLDQLEAGRQQREAAEKEQSEHDDQISAMQGKIDLAVAGFRVANSARERAEAEISALRGEQEPVAFTDNEELSMLSEGRQTHVDIWLKPYGFGRDIPLFTRPPVPVVVLPKNGMLSGRRKIAGVSYIELDVIISLMHTAGITVKGGDEDDSWDTDRHPRGDGTGIGE